MNNILPGHDGEGGEGLGNLLSGEDVDNLVLGDCARRVKTPFPLANQQKKKISATTTIPPQKNNSAAIIKDCTRKL
jgi:hypothetical protein